MNSHIGAWPPGHAKPQISSSSETFRSQWKNVLTSIDRNTPLWNRAWLLACDIGPELDRFGPDLDNVELESCCTHSLEFTGENISDTSYQSLLQFTSPLASCFPTWSCLLIFPDSSPPPPPPPPRPFCL